MGPEQLQAKLEALSNTIEEAIATFERETTSVVSSISLKRNPDGGADVTVNPTPLT
jgi:hypothetical protein